MLAMPMNGIARSAFAADERDPVGHVDLVRLGLERVRRRAR